MKPWVIRWRLHALKWQYLVIELVIAFSLVAVITSPVSAAMRLQERSLYMNSTDAGETTFYRIGFRYMSPDPVGSVEMLFCMDPIPYHPCVPPDGLDVSGAELTEQVAETGYTIHTRTANRIVLSRAPVAPGSQRASYTLGNMVNPNNQDQAFSIRLKTLASADGSGGQIDFGSVRGQITRGIDIASQVPPMLIFCLADQVEENCVNVSEVNYADMGILSAEDTLTAKSEMAVGTNASAGFVISAHGTPMSAGTNIIESSEVPTPSVVGQNQFGINLVANNEPEVGHDPEGAWENAIVATDYSQPNLYKFVSGDLVASSPNVSLMKKFTVSYVVNSSPDLHPGVYTTTVNFIAMGRF